MKPKENILIQARDIVIPRVESLSKDVKYCVLQNEGQEGWPAPLPALLYCFATIDLLAALYDGNAESFGTISKRAKSYMTHVMNYSEDVATLLQEVFRHKIVHLAQLQPKVTLDQKVYTWRYYHCDRAQHLTVVELDKAAFLYEFRVSIWSLAEDIANSVTAPGGYLDRLNQRESLRKNFEIAHAQIFTP